MGSKTRDIFVPGGAVVEGKVGTAEVVAGAVTGDVPAEGGLLAAAEGGLDPNPENIRVIESLRSFLNLFGIAGVCVCACV